MAMSTRSPKEAANSRYRSLFGLENKKLPEIERKNTLPATVEPLPTRINRFLNEVMKITVRHSKVYYSPEFNSENLANNSTSPLQSIFLLKNAGRFINQEKYRVYQEQDPIQILNRAMKVIKEVNLKLGIIRDSDCKR